MQNFSRNQKFTMKILLRTHNFASEWVISYRNTLYNKYSSTFSCSMASFITTCFRKNYAIVQIYYEALNSYHIQETAAYSVPQLFADFGGFFSCLLGASVLTMVEFVFCLADLIVYMLSHGRISFV